MKKVNNVIILTDKDQDLAHSYMSTGDVSSPIMSVIENKKEKIIEKRQESLDDILEQIDKIIGSEEVRMEKSFINIRNTNRVGEIHIKSKDRYIILGKVENILQKAEVNDIIEIQVKEVQMSNNDVALVEPQIVSIRKDLEEPFTFNQVIEAAEQYNEFLLKASHSGLVPRKVKVTSRKGKIFFQTRWVDPQTGHRVLRAKTSNEERSVREAQRGIESEARQERQEEVGTGTRGEYGPTEIPWYEKEGIKREDTDDKITYSGKGLKINVMDTGMGWAIIENGKRVGIVNKEREAHSWVKDRFDKVKKSIDTEASDNADMEIPEEREETDRQENAYEETR